MSMVRANCNYLNWKAHILNQLQIFQRKHAQTEPVATIWSQSGIYILCQMQLFQLKNAWSEPIAMIPSEMRRVWANCNDFKWNTNSRSQSQLFQLSPHSLSQLQRFKVKQAYLSREIRTVWANCNHFIWNKHSPRQLQQFQAKTCIVWGNGHYLSQLQLFQEQRA